MNLIMGGGKGVAHTIVLGIVGRSSEVAAQRNPTRSLADGECHQYLHPDGCS
jgi:hypothetical protein